VLSSQNVHITVVPATNVYSIWITIASGLIIALVFIIENISFWLWFTQWWWQVSLLGHWETNSKHLFKKNLEVVLINICHNLVDSYKMKIVRIQWPKINKPSRLPTQNLTLIKNPSQLCWGRCFWRTQIPSRISV